MKDLITKYIRFESCNDGIYVDKFHNCTWIHDSTYYDNEPHIFDVGTMFKTVIVRRNEGIVEFNDYKDDCVYVLELEYKLTVHETQFIEDPDPYVGYNPAVTW